MMNIKSKIVTECAQREKVPQYARVLTTLGFLELFYFMAESIEEIVVDHELAKDTLRGWHPLYS